VVKAAREHCKDKGQGMIKSTKWSESDGLLMFRGKIYVPKGRELMCCIVEQHHDTCIAALLRPSRWYLKTTGGHRCHDTLASTSRPAICVIEPSYNTDVVVTDLLGSAR
jgi:hypothetical protein